MIKKILKYVKRFLILVVGVSSLYLVNLFLMKPFSIDHFLGKELVLGLIDSPEAMTYMGVFDNFNWFTRHNSKLSIPGLDTPTMTGTLFFNLSLYFLIRDFCSSILSLWASPITPNIVTPETPLFR